MAAWNLSSSSTLIENIKDESDEEKKERQFENRKAVSRIVP
jgi:hypothetical protein